MEIDAETFVRVIEDNAKNNERLAKAIEGLSSEVKEIHKKHRIFPINMHVIQLEMGFILIVTVGILFKLMTF